MKIDKAEITLEQLKKTIASIGISRQDLAKKLDVSIHTINAWVTGRNPVSVIIWQKLLQLSKGTKEKATTRLPIQSHYCRTTHTACDCVLTRLSKLEEVAERARSYLLDDSPLTNELLRKALDNLEGGEE